MDKQKDIDSILDRVMHLSNSFSAAPYSFSSFSLENGSEISKSGILSGFTHIISISLWKDFSAADLRDYFILSKEYLSISSESDRENFLSAMLLDILPEQKFCHWKALQVSLALGLLLSVSISKGYKTRCFSIEELQEELQTALKGREIHNQEMMHVVLI
ncbi:hypothetical protein AAFH68_17010 [Flavobacterium sp. CGRL1]